MAAPEGEFPIKWENNRFTPLETERPYCRRQQDWLPGIWPPGILWLHEHRAKGMDSPEAYKSLRGVCPDRFARCERSVGTALLLDAQGSRRKNKSFLQNSPDRESNIEKTAGSGRIPDPAVLLSPYVVLSFPVDHPDMGLSHSTAFGAFGAHTRLRSACRYEANTLPPTPGAHVLDPFTFSHTCLLIVQ